MNLGWWRECGGVSGCVTASLKTKRPERETFKVANDKYGSYTERKECI